MYISYTFILAYIALCLNKNCGMFFQMHYIMNTPNIRGLERDFGHKVAGREDRKCVYDKQMKRRNMSYRTQKYNNLSGEREKEIAGKNIYTIYVFVYNLIKWL